MLFWLCLEDGELWRKLRKSSRWKPQKIDIPIGVYVNTEIDANRAVSLDFQWLQSDTFITTIGGICGRVVNIKEDALVIETGADRNKMTIKKWALQSCEEKWRRLL